ncbi:hypothetical protein N5D66_28060 [Delftia tsuruhatensis]|jgi:hypothetical protein|uniref:hypothetical protein n=1 Tax=Delftia tsuruhatensis TaxID=180282 RepID=UPI0024481EFE|nr:hypothetical protein [Delftia tsuruhatensis]MDH0851820.1 hypothetical protein [Delftia tsuruhatensis]
MEDQKEVAASPSAARLSPAFLAKMKGQLQGALGDQERCLQDLLLTNVLPPEALESMRLSNVQLKTLIETVDQMQCEVRREIDAEAENLPAWLIEAIDEVVCEMMPPDAVLFELIGPGGRITLRRNGIHSGIPKGLSPVNFAAAYLPVLILKVAAAVLVMTSEGAKAR